MTLNIQIFHKVSFSSALPILIMSLSVIYLWNNMWHKTKQNVRTKEQQKTNGLWAFYCGLEICLILCFHYYKCVREHLHLKLIRHTKFCCNLSTNCESSLLQKLSRYRPTTQSIATSIRLLQTWLLGYKANFWQWIWGLPLQDVGTTHSLCSVAVYITFLGVL